MLQDFDSENLFLTAERSELGQLGLPNGGSEGDNRFALAGLMLSPVVEIAVSDGATTGAEFEQIEQFLTVLESKFELATREQMESVGTAMGMVPFISGEWPTGYFHMARNILSSLLKRLPQEDAHELRNALSRACYEVARASGGIFHLGGISDEEEHILFSIADDLGLQHSAEGLQLIGRLRKSEN